MQNPLSQKSLSSLRILGPEGQGQSRPKSQSSPKVGLPREVSTDTLHRDNSAAFQDFPDYAKLNADKHNASRSDTFKTPPSPRKKANPGVTVTPGDLAGDASYVVSGIRHEVREIGKDIKAEIQEDVQQTLLLVRKDVQSTLDIITDTREATIGVVMTRLTEDIHKVLADAGWPLKVDFTPLEEAFVKGGDASKQCYCDMMQSLEDRLEQRLGTFADEFPALRKSQQQLQEDFEASQQRMLQESALAQKALAEDLTKAVQGVQQTQKRFFDQNDDLKESIEATVVKHVKEQPVNVDSSEIMSNLTALMQREGSHFERLQKELQRVTKDMSHVRDDVSKLLEGKSQSEKKTSEPKKKMPMEDMWTQTETTEVRENFAQTDDKYWKAKLSGAKSKTQSKSDEQKASTVEMTNSTAAKVAKGNAGVFADADSMRKKARQALIKTQYNVTEFYHSTGFFQKIARSSIFENMTLLMVTINAIWLSVDTDLNDASLLVDADPTFIVAENIFCTYFFCEVLIRFCAFKQKKRAFKDYWFLFDFILVLLMVLETWVMSLLVLLVSGGVDTEQILDPSMLRLVRIVKILRLSRLARLMRAVPEIIVFLKGIGAAARSVISLFGLWTIIIYIFAVFFVQAADGDWADFQNVPTAMNTLLLEGILPDNSILINLVIKQNGFFWPIVVSFVLLASITLSYMLIGVLVQIVQVIAVAEKERCIVGVVANHLRGEWYRSGYDEDAVITKENFQALLIEPQIALFLQEVGVDVLVLVDMSDMIYDDIAKEQRGLSFESFVDAVLNMRGTNPVTVQDVKSQLRIMKRMIKDSVEKLEENFTKQFGKTAKQIQRVKKVVIGEEDPSESEPEGSGGEEGLQSMEPISSQATGAASLQALLSVPS